MGCTSESMYDRGLRAVHKDKLCSTLHEGEEVWASWGLTACMWATHVVEPQALLCHNLRRHGWGAAVLCRAS